MSFKIGDVVKVFSLMNPRRDFKGYATIRDIGPMNDEGEDMLWLKGHQIRVSGAIHPDSCELAKEEVGKHSGV